MVHSSLQAYADRGVFRGLRATPASRGRVAYEFLWLTRTPTRAVFDQARGVLAFPLLFPGIDKAAAADLAVLVKSRTRRDLPDHKRLDARKARLTSTIRKGDFSLAMEIRGRNHDYAVKKALNLINEMFVELHERHPAYLVERFGMSTE